MKKRAKFFIIEIKKNDSTDHNLVCLHHWADDDLIVDDYGPFLNRMHSKNRALRWIQYWC